jgi:RNA polymerase sigma-70 factor (ECF subfamily)
MSPLQTDNELYIAYLRDGCHESFTELVNRHYSRVESYFTRVVRDPVRAQDLTQDAFARIIASRTFDSSRSFLSWFYTIADNLAKNEFRSRGRRRVLPEAEFRVREDTSVGVLDFALAPDSQEDDLQTRRLEEQLERALQQLSAEARLIFEYSFVDGLSVAETAARLGQPAAAIKAKRTRVRARVRRLMGPELNG